MDINLLDIILIVPLLLFAWGGFKKGLIVEVASLFALVLGLYMAFFFSDFAAEMLNNLFEMEQKYIAVFAFLLTFVVVLFLVLLVGKIVQKFIDILLLGFFNKLAGAVFGILKGALLISIVIFVINYFDAGEYIFKNEVREKSIFYEPVESIAPALYSWLDSKNFTFEIPDKEEILDAVY
ncbi:MAG: CvpA family protein [Bacteroidetes bacterium]|nr:CvpA family protein [Bacteroidota bacterium]MBL6942740.1 CvpA family protein [Bacteroidales bacterium]